MIWFAIWYLIGVSIMVYFVLWHGDLKVKDVPWILLPALFGPLMLGLLYQEKMLKLPKLIDGEIVLIKKKKK